jgi:hypothetical protein
MPRHTRRFRPATSGALLVAAMVLFGGLVATGPPAAGARGFSWAIVPTPNISPSETNVLAAVTCVSTSDCWAVGHVGIVNPDGSPDLNAHSLAEHWNGTAWSIVSTNSIQFYLTAVSCISSSDCWAVGMAVDGMLAEHWDGSAWTVVATPGTIAVISDISCPSSSDCWAVGEGTNGFAGQTLAEHWNGTSWSIVSTPNIAITRDNGLFGVSCVSSSDCWAVGSLPNEFEATLTEHWNGSAWAIVPSPNGSFGGRSRVNHLGHVTCVSSSDCWAVGSHAPSATYPAAALSEHWNGAAWSVVGTRNLHGRGNGLSGVSCSSSSDCWAVGGGGTHPPFRTLTEHWNGRRWSLVFAPANGLAAVYCVGSSDCWAVGSQPGSGGSSQTLAEHGT